MYETTREDERRAPVDRRSPRPTVAPSRPQGSAWPYLAIFVAGTLAVALAAWAFSTAIGDDAGEGSVRGVTVDKIVTDTESFLGETVTVSAVVSGVFPPNAIEIGGDDFGEGGEILVVSPTLQELLRRAEGGEAAEEDIVQVTGRVERMTLAEIQEQLGVTLDEGFFPPYEENPVIVAEDVVVSPKTTNR